MAASINLSLAGDLADGHPELRARVGDACSEVEEALAELREVAHGLYPQALGRWGSLELSSCSPLATRNGVAVLDACADRFPSEVEAAVYYCCMEAVQNAFKHAGPDAHVSIRLYTEADQLHLDVRDNRPGFEVTAARDGVGLQNMSDRLGAVGGRVDVISEPGKDTLVVASVPVSTPPDNPPRATANHHASVSPRLSPSVTTLHLSSAAGSAHAGHHRCGDDP